MPSPFKTPQEMDKIRENDAPLREKELKARQNEPPKMSTKPVAYFQVSRYTDGPFRGLLLIDSLETADEKGRPLKKPVKKVVAEGVDMVIGMASLETALRKKVYG